MLSLVPSFGVEEGHFISGILVIKIKHLRVSQMMSTDELHDIKFNDIKFNFAYVIKF